LRTNLSTRDPAPQKQQAGAAIAQNLQFHRRQERDAHGVPVSQKEINSKKSRLIAILQNKKKD
jgi:hypothetical protein